MYKLLVLLCLSLAFSACQTESAEFKRLQAQFKTLQKDVTDQKINDFDIAFEKIKALKTSIDNQLADNKGTSQLHKEIKTWEESLEGEQKLFKKIKKKKFLLARVKTINEYLDTYPESVKKDAVSEILIKDLQKIKDKTVQFRKQQFPKLAKNSALLYTGDKAFEFLGGIAELEFLPEEGPLPDPKEYDFSFKETVKAAIGLKKYKDETTMNLVEEIFKELDALDTEIETKVRSKLGEKGENFVDICFKAFMKILKFTL